METKEEYLKKHRERLEKNIADKPEMVEKILANLGDAFDRNTKERALERKRLNEIVKRMIPKEELVDGGLYLAQPEYTRGMWFGVWDKEKEVFQCMRYKFGFQVFPLPYLGDAKENDAAFAPMQKVEKFE